MQENIIIGGSNIAVVGMSCRFPGARNVSQFWHNLCSGMESIIRLSDVELLSAGIDSQTLAKPNYVKAGAFLDDIDLFDPSFFGFSPRDAAIMDPQHRLFLECSWEALEYAGHTPENFRGSIGVYGGCGMNLYLIYNLLSNPDLIETVGFWLLRHLGNDKDFLTTRVSYCLDLKGPSVNIQTACSTSLVAIHAACQSLLNGECDMALAGGVTIVIPHRQGYFYQEGEIHSPDGHCRAFDHRAQGTVFGSGVGVVVLRRLEDALKDGDTIHAVVKGSAVNNDGAGKVGYFAPSIDGHAQVVTEALNIAEIEPESVTYIEAHGTGTAIGDPVEIRALTEAFRAGTRRNQFCGIGSVKTNIGHLDMAAGVASFIKIVGALKHKRLPPSLHFEAPNPIINFKNSPFFVVDQLCDWEPEGVPRRAGVSSLGVGGTNAHVILEEAPPPEIITSSRLTQLLTLSARNETALDRVTQNLVQHLRDHPEIGLADVAYTLHVGRRSFSHRRMVVCNSVSEAIVALEELPSQTILTQSQDRERPSVVFMFTGQGAQYVQMGLELYSTERVFQAELDRCFDLLEPHLNLDLRRILYPEDQALEEATKRLSETAITQPVLFAMEYALAQLWMSWGIQPQAMIGHSIGEYVAACLAGVFLLEDALALVATRGRLMQEQPSGLMLAIPLSEEKVIYLLNQEVGVCLAAVNGSDQCVVSGSTAEIERFEERLAGEFVPYRRLQTSHAFHSYMMDPVLEDFTREVLQKHPRFPKLPFISNLTGTWIKEEEACDPAYWAHHMRGTVRFATGLHELFRDPECILVEIGPGRTLANLARQHPERTTSHVVLQSLPHPDDHKSDVASLLNALGQLWLNGLEVDWSAVYSGEKRRRIPLPTYPFERQRCWIDPGTVTQKFLGHEATACPEASLDNWFWRPVWRKAAPLSLSSTSLVGDWLVFLDASGFGSSLLKSLSTSMSGSPEEEQPLRLALAVPGELESITLQACQRRELEGNEVEIRVQYAGLNFRDVLNAMGVYPEGPVPLGSECVGTVTRLGKHVEGLEMGCEVIAIAPDTFRTHATANTNFVFRKPKHLSLQQAATIPVVFMTAYYALHHIGRLSQGERVLIHAAAGGVGLAAVRLAQLVKAEVFATAGSTQKREYLKSIGVEHVFDSRSLDFAERILETTNGEGVDVVLNSLAGEFISKSLALLKPFGRFLEIGKSDIYQNAQLGLEPFKKGLAFHAIDLEIVARERPDLYRQLFRELLEHFERGQLEPLPYQNFSAAAADQAFKYMAEAQHIGKIVLRFQALIGSAITVRAGETFRQLNEAEYIIDPTHPEHYSRLLENVCKAGHRPHRILHLWNIEGSEFRPTSLESLEDSKTRGFYSLLYLAQAIAQQDLADSIKMVVVSDHMQQVLPEDMIQPVKSILLGPVRVIPHEFHNVQCKSVDLAMAQRGSADEQHLCARLIAEFQCEEPSVSIVAYRGADRYVQSFERIQLENAGFQERFREGGVYLITGGLGGIGLVLAEHLARRFHAKLILVGRSTLPPRTIWSSHDNRLEDERLTTIVRKLQAIEVAGGEVLSVTADVSDVASMKSIISQALDRFGAIHGVIHAAGVLDDGLIQLKDAEAAARVLTPKIDGTLVLDSICQDLDLDFMVLFSSTSAALGLVGQVDYTAANAFLNAFARSKQSNGSPRTLSLGWGPWQKVGMAARMAEVKESRAHRALQEPPSHPFLEACLFKTPKKSVYTTRFRLEDHWLVNEHKIRGIGALIPGTGYLELARACLGQDAENRCVELRNVLFTAPCDLRTHETRELWITLESQEDGYSFLISSQDREGQTVDHAQGFVRSIHPEASKVHDLAAIIERCQISSTNGAQSNEHFEFGPRWNNLRQLHFGQDEALATLELAKEFVHDLETTRLHPALLDIATSCALPLIENFDAHSEYYVPVSCASLQAYRAVPQKIYSHLRCRNGKVGKEFVSFDITVMNATGEEIVEISEFTFRRIVATSQLVETRSASARGLQPRSATSESKALGSSAHVGILPEQGIEAFTHAVSLVLDEPEIFISPQNLVESLDAVEASGHDIVDDVQIERTLQIAQPHPEMAAPCDGPHDETEQVIAEIWRKILGVEHIGMKDNFFEIGADSLSALRVMSQIKSKLSARISVQDLYEHPTIEALSKWLGPE